MSTQMVRRALAGFTLALAPIAVGGVWLAVRHDLPDPMATHWGFGGEADGFSRPGPFVAIITAATAAAAVLGVVLLVADRHRSSVRMMAGVIGWVAWLLAAAGVSSMLVARGVGDAHDVRSGWGVMTATIAVAATGAVLAYWLVPLAAERDTAAVPAATYDLKPGERAVWIGTARSAPLLLTAVALAVAAAGLLLYSVMWAGVALLVALPMVWTHSISVRIDNDAVTAHFGPLGWPEVRTPISRIRTASVQDIDPLRWGGWGYRISRRGTALVVRRGPGLVLTRTTGSDLAITVDAPEQGAELINALLARSNC